MKKLLLVFLMILSGFQTLKSQSTLVAGDIAIIGYNADNIPDNFSFIPLKDLAAGTVINFTDLVGLPNQMVSNCPVMLPTHQVALQTVLLHGQLL
ncbi:MAG: hypothetical protein HC787_10935 [Nostocaceae cyanobacterium CSU_2_110]|nr:hypothetical protein [Nostocaceae cyanobacterium CSU_2_110]